MGRMGRLGRFMSAAVATSYLACVACAEKTVQQPGPAYARAESVPADITARPHVVYQGRLVYWVNERWYVRNGQDWVYYVDPPPALVHREPATPATPTENTAAVRAPEFGTPAERAAPSSVEPP
jgi:hypothetical protein